MLKSVFFFLASLGLSLAISNALVNPPSSAKIHPNKANIQLALLLDTSNSMDGLIEQAKSQLWKMVNELARSQRDGQTTHIELSLYEYGNDDLSVNNGYVRQVVAMTTDLDEVSEQLFKLRTNGGSEYCGTAIKDALQHLEWNKDKQTMRLIIIAGNEAFDQGPVSPEEACELLVKKDVNLTTIFCGNWQKGNQIGWKTPAICAQGRYLNIDSDRQITHIPTPFDDRILQLNLRLNQTYIGYGSKGKEKMLRQTEQDKNASVYGSANLRERATFKAKKQYNNASWDLVDAVEASPEIIETTDANLLPPKLQKMDKKALKELLEEKKKEREEIQSELLQLEKKVASFIKNKNQNMNEVNTLEDAMKSAIQELAEEKGFQFK